MVHGAYHGSWCWSGIVARLEAEGHWAQTVELPGRGDTTHLAATVTLDDWVGALGAVVAAAPTPPIVVAHSMGGVTANQYAAVHANTIAAIVYVCAIAPCDGHSGTETILEAGSTSALLQDDTAVPGPNQTAVLTEAGAAEALYGLCSQSDTQRALARLCPEPINPLLAPVTLSSSFRRVPKAYIATRDDRAVPLPFQISLAGRMDATLDVIDGDHSPFYSAPEALLEALLKYR